MSVYEVGDVVSGVVDDNPARVSASMSADLFPVILVSLSKDDTLLVDGSPSQHP